MNSFPSGSAATAPRAATWCGEGRRHDSSAGLFDPRARRLGVVDREEEARDGPGRPSTVRGARGIPDVECEGTASRNDEADALLVGLAHLEAKRLPEPRGPLQVVDVDGHAKGASDGAVCRGVERGGECADGVFVTLLDALAFGPGAPTGGSLYESSIAQLAARDRVRSGIGAVEDVGEQTLLKLYCDSCRAVTIGIRSGPSMGSVVFQWASITLARPAVRLNAVTLSASWKKIPAPCPEISAPGGKRICPSRRNVPSAGEAAWAAGAKSRHRTRSLHSRRIVTAALHGGL